MLRTDKLNGVKYEQVYEKGTNRQSTIKNEVIWKKKKIIAVKKKNKKKKDKINSNDANRKDDIPSELMYELWNGAREKNLSVDGFRHLTCKVPF